MTRRQMTVLFCDLVGSTALADRIDPEDLYDVLSAFGEMVRRVASGFGGHVARIVGDGVDVYFGYPLAGEDDAVRAVHAGLAIVAQADRLQQEAGIVTAVQVRVGIATGLVAVGAQEGLAIAGGTPNLAARIQGVAQPGQVTIAPSTRRIAGAQFAYEDLGLFELKGFEEPVRLTAIMGAGEPDSRSAWRGHDTAIPLAGRDAELAILAACWEHAASGCIAGVLVIAEAGLGKSRLACALDQQLVSTPHTTLRLQCSPFHANSMLRPVVQHLVQAAGCAREDTALVQLEKLEAQLAIAGIDAELDRSLVASLLDVHSAGRYPPLDLPAPVQLQMTRDVLRRYFAGLASAHAPLLLIVEDLHWIDPTSLVLLDELLAAQQRAPILVLMTSRPERMPPMAAQSTHMQLGRLDEQASRALATCVAPGLALPASEIETIIRRSDGVPLFIEEMTRMVADSHTRRDGGAGLRQGGVPDTLMDLLMERLDRSGPGKWLAQVGAVIGHEFSRRLLSSAAGMDPLAFENALSAMRTAGLALPVDSRADRFAFKHALIEEAAYDSIVPKIRIALHGRLADLLASEFSDVIERQPELAARHLSRAQRPLEAGRFFLQAGGQALGRGALREAAAHLSEGVAVLADAPAGHGRSEAELALLSMLGPTTMVLKGPGSEAFRDVQRRAFTLCHELPGAPRQFPVTYGLCLYHWGRAELETAQGLAEGLLEVADARANDDEAVIAAHNMSGMVKLSLGDVRAARAHLERSVARYDPQRDAGLYPVYLMDFGVFGRFYLALATLISGDEELASRQVGEAHELAARLNQPHTLGFSMVANTTIAVMREQPALARTCAQRCIDFCTQTGFSEFMGLARIARGWALAREGQTAAGLEDMEAGIRLWLATGFENWQSWFASLRADLLVELGRPDEALLDIDLHLARMDHGGETLFRSLLLAQKAMLAGTDRDLREQLMAEAQAVAAAQDAVAWTRRIEARGAALG